MSSTPSFNCIFCKEVFENKEDLQVHFRKHGDPAFNNKNRFEINAQMSTDKSKEKEMVSCDVCSQVFPTISKAITHKHKVHPDHDAKYFCPWCGKLFTMKHLYNIHIQTNHKDDTRPEEQSFHCDTCNVDFFVPSAVMYHNKFFHRQDTDIPDVGLSKKVKLVNQEVLSIYYCAFCGEEFDNKVNLFKHMTDDHNDENQCPEEVLRCPVCDAVFYHLDAYEIHLTFHSQEDMYTAKNDLYEDLTDFSLETVPPSVEKVENLPEGETEEADPESAINAVGIEKFLELAMDASNDSNPIKIKKHKKHKKSKKAAITLDEFLSMNTDVFGEDLDIQGVEEIPTRVVKKHLKTNNKKQVKALKAVTTAELAKLKKHGIVIKKKKANNAIVKGLQLTPVKSMQNAQTKIKNKMNPETEIKTSNEMLSKLINQSNNQIKIVKKPNTDSEQVINTDMKQVEETNTQNNIVESNESDEKSEPLHLQRITENCSIKLQCSPSPILEKTLSISKNAKIIQAHDIKHHVPKQTNDGIACSDNKNKICESVPSLRPERSKSMEECNNDPPESYESDQENIDDHVDSDEHNNCDDEIVEPTYQDINTKTSTKEEPLSHLKHLSHLITVKSVNKNKEHATQNTAAETKSDTNSNKIDNFEASISLPNKDNTESAVKPQPLPKKELALDALKNLRNTITIKSFPKSSNKDFEETGSEHESGDDERLLEKTATNKPISEVVANKDITIKKIKVENEKIITSPNPAGKLAVPGSAPVKMIKPQFDINSTKNSTEITDNTAKKITDDILKRFPNITTKPVIVKTEPQPFSEQQTNQKSEKLPEGRKEEEIIEIFDVDDSDDEHEANVKTSEPSQKKPLNDNIMRSEQNRKIQEMNIKKLETNNATTKTVDPLKNLSKHITVKSFNHQPIIKNIKVENHTTSEEEYFEDLEGFPVDFDDDDDDIPVNISNVKTMNIKQCSQKLSNKSMAFNSALKKINKNITVKSSNSSPNYPTKSQEHNSQDIYDHFEGSDSDSSPGNVKITEVDQNISDSEINLEKDEKPNQPIVESPHDSEEEHEQEHLDAQDFESEIMANTVPKYQHNVNIDKNSACLNNLKNINKNLTIKSINSNDNNQSTQPQESQQSSVQNEDPNDNKSNKQFGKMISKNLTVANQQIDQTSNQSLNKKMSCMNQQNTVNKEVTVKTFQTKTVIQEITTTVTKTIKTVNQTVKQEVRNACQSSSSMVQQNVQGMKPSPSKNLQGVVIKHAPSNVTPIKVSNPTMRPMTTVVRPANQIVPVRPGLNVAMRPSTNVARLSKPRMPRMPVAKKVAPPPTQNNQGIGKTLKISPNAMTSKIVKRPNTGEVSGPFSCFKKPKESLIPVSDVPSFSSSGESTAQFTATSHTSTSNFSSTMKVLNKGNSVVTASQMKTEMSSSSQQISRQNNATGIKVKMSQTNQCQVQEKSETSGMKRTTLEAIQKLQKQGLLIKKPRVENDNSGDFNNVDEDNL